MNPHVEIIKLTIRVGDNEITVTPDEYHALCRAAKELILEPEPDYSPIQEYLRKESAKMREKMLRKEHERRANDLRLANDLKRVTKC